MVTHCGYCPGEVPAENMKGLCGLHSFPGHSVRALQRRYQCAAAAAAAWARGTTKTRGFLWREHKRNLGCSTAEDSHYIGGKRSGWVVGFLRKDAHCVRLLFTFRQSFAPRSFRARSTQRALQFQPDRSGRRSVVPESRTLQYLYSKSTREQAPCSIQQLYSWWSLCAA